MLNHAVRRSLRGVSPYNVRLGRISAGDRARLSGLFLFAPRHAKARTARHNKKNTAQMGDLSRRWKEKRASRSRQRRNGKTRLVRRLRINLRRGQLDQPACCRLHRRNEHALAPRLLLWCERLLHRALCRSWSRKRPFSQSGNVLDPLSLSAQSCCRD
jgi:hypothetical protein